MERQKTRWRVETDRGTHETCAVSARKARSNARYRLVMDSRAYRWPTPEDWTAMREIEILRVVALDAVTGEERP